MNDILDELSGILLQIEQMQGGIYIESADGYREVKRLFAKSRECIEKLRSMTAQSQETAEDDAIRVQADAAYEHALWKYFGRRPNG